MCLIADLYPDEAKTDARTLTEICDASAFPASARLAAYAGTPTRHPPPRQLRHGEAPPRRGSRLLACPGSRCSCRAPRRPAGMQPARPPRVQGRESAGSPRAAPYRPRPSRGAGPAAPRGLPIEPGQDLLGHGELVALGTHLGQLSHQLFFEYVQFSASFCDPRGDLGKHHAIEGRAIHLTRGREPGNRSDSRSRTLTAAVDVREHEETPPCQLSRPAHSRWRVRTDDRADLAQCVAGRRVDNDHPSGSVAPTDSGGPFGRVPLVP